MTKKLPFQISLEDLLSQLETSDESPSLDELISFRNDVPFFLSKFKMENGEHFVRSSILYKLYCIYSPNPLDRTAFTKEASNFIPFNTPYFKLNISPHKLIKILNPPTNINRMSSAHIKKHYEKFIEIAKITKGTKWVESYFFFEIYRFHCIDAKIKNKLRYEFFVTISKLYFEYRRIGSSKGVYFKLDPQLLSILSPEHQEKIRESRKMSEKNKQKRRSK